MSVKGRKNSKTHLHLHLHVWPCLVVEAVIWLFSAIFSSLFVLELEGRGRQVLCYETPSLDAWDRNRKCLSQCHSVYLYLNNKTRRNGNSCDDSGLPDADSDARIPVSVVVCHLQKPQICPNPWVTDVLIICAHLIIYWLNNVIPPCPFYKLF